MIRKIYQGLKSLEKYRRLVLYCYSMDKKVKGYLKNTPQPELTLEEKREIDRYWKQYGIKFKNYDWFQWYYGFTGVKSPKFIPWQVHGKMILPYYNERFGTEFYLAFSDKNLFYDFMPEVNFPEPILKNIDGTFFDKHDHYISGRDCLINLLTAGQEEIIVKKSIGTCKGKSVRKYSITSRQDAENLLDDWKNESNYIVQKAIKQHPFFARFNESSVNVMRINSLCINGEVALHTPILRFGYPGWTTDIGIWNGLEDGRFVGITEDGYLMDDVVSMQRRKWKLSDVVEDPENRKIPAWDEIVALVKENAPKLKHIGRIGWDITVAEDGKPVVIEYNIATDHNLPQFAVGPLFGELTDTVLEFLKDEKNQKRYIPHWMRA